MLPSLASLADLSTWLDQRLTGSAAARAQAILDAASILVRTHTSQAWVVEGEDGPETEEGVTELRLDAVRTVTLTVAARVYLNPHGAVSQTTGPFSRSVADWAALGMALTDGEKAMLSGGAFRGLGTIPTTRGPLETAPVACLTGTFDWDGHDWAEDIP